MGRFKAQNFRFNQVGSGSRQGQGQTKMTILARLEHQIVSLDALPLGHRNHIANWY